MDTKEAIDVLIFSDNGIGHWRQNYRKIIKLLEEGEKYRQMWEELKEIFIILHKDYETGEKYYAGTIMKCDIREIEQKYFPKEK